MGKKLDVAGAYHSRLMAPAQEKLAAELAEPPSATWFPVVCNVDARPVAGAADIRETLTRQVTGSVRWAESMQHLIAGIACSSNWTRRRARRADGAHRQVRQGHLDQRRRLAGRRCRRIVGANRRSPSTSNRFRRVGDRVCGIARMLRRPSVGRSLIPMRTKSRHLIAVLAAAAAGFASSRRRQPAQGLSGRGYNESAGGRAPRSAICSGNWC
ncbi:MAG: hypothetical protein R3F11_06640 [Verrucomicrobiales bacterium]